METTEQWKITCMRCNHSWRVETKPTNYAIPPGISAECPKCYDDTIGFKKWERLGHSSGSVDYSSMRAGKRKEGIPQEKNVSKMNILQKLFGKKERGNEVTGEPTPQSRRVTRSNVRRVSGRFWKCPKCGTILRKSLVTMDEAKSPGAVFIGRSTCSCGAAYLMGDVYSGRYDVTVDVEIPSGLCPLRTEDGFCRKSKIEASGKLLYACPWTDGAYILDCAVYDSEFIK